MNDCRLCCVCRMPYVRRATEQREMRAADRVGHERTYILCDECLRSGVCAPTTGEWRTCHECGLWAHSSNMSQENRFCPFCGAFSECQGWNEPCFGPGRLHTYLEGERGRSVVSSHFTDCVRERELLFAFADCRSTE